MKFYGGIQSGDMGLPRWVNECNFMRIRVVACPDRGTWNDPETLRLAFHHQGPVCVHMCVCVCVWLGSFVNTSSGEGIVAMPRPILFFWIKYV